MKTWILTIPRQQHRVWALLGHLQTKEFPVDDPELVKIYNGFDCRDYESVSHIESLIRKDGYKNVYVDSKGVNKIHPDPELQVMRNVCVEWGFRKILEKIVESKEQILVLENDTDFNKGLTYESLTKHWENLVNIVGFDNINVAMLFYYEKHNELGLGENEKIDGFWCKGSRNLGQVANIYTPHGARFLLSRKAFLPSVETYLGYNPDMLGLFSAYENQVNLHYFSNFDSDGLSRRSPEFWFNHYKGEQL